MVYLNSYNVLKYEAPHSEHPETKSKLSRDKDSCESCRSLQGFPAATQFRLSTENEYLRQTENHVTKDFEYLLDCPQ